MCGDVGGSAKKVGRRIKELERLYGISHGGDRKSESSPNKLESAKTQQELAKDLGMNIETLRNYKLLADMIPELEELLNVEKSVINNLLKKDVFYCKIKIITYCEVI